jgi:multidrug resistance efflux pump
MRTDKSTLTDEPVRIRPDVDGSAATVQKRKWPLTRLALPGTLAAAALLYWGLDYILEGLTHESTDDAFIEAHIVAVAPRISGQISSVHVSDNQLVKQGELLVEIDPRDYEMRLNQKRAAAQTTDANLKSVLSAYTLMKTKVDTAEAATGQARAEADASKAVAARAATDFERGRQLLAQGAISQQEFDHARAAARESEAKAKADEQKAVEEASKVVEAKAQLAATQALVDVAEAQVRQVQTDIHAAELDLSYTKIRAPCAGRVTRKAVETGLLRPGRPGRPFPRPRGSLGGRQFQGDPAGAYATRPGSPDRHRGNSQTTAPWSRRQHPGRQRVPVQPAPAGKCGGEFRQGRPARAGKDPV